MNINFIQKFFLTIVLSVLVCFSFNKPAFAIRIGLLDGVRENYVAASKSGIIVDAKSNRKLLDLKPMKKYKLKKHGKNIAVLLDGKYYTLGTRCIIVKSPTQSFISTKNKWYRGEIVIVNNGSGLTFINNITLEGYLMGVVPSEMPTSWNIEAHKAQAIAARSYAIANMGKRASRGYDLKDTPEDQAYGGASSENTKTTNAVLKTRGQVITYANKIIPAYYHASSGGRTLDAQRVWNKRLPYIKSVPGYDSHKRKSGHGVGMSQYGANALAGYGYSAYQILGYFYNNVRISKINTSL